MPYSDKEKHNEAAKKQMRKYRARKQNEDEEWKRKEAERKAAWYAENKEKKAEAQRRYRQAKREQMLIDLAKGLHPVFALMAKEEATTQVEIKKATYVANSQGVTLKRKMLFFG